ncbi:hypothetical protein ACFWVM_03160 [Nocardia fluminea]|uniref:hypothetical protein n=1 Tax=Nocardia fluminea TaxID=134984 RepID=UPI00365B8EE5
MSETPAVEDHQECAALPARGLFLPDAAVRGDALCDRVLPGREHLFDPAQIHRQSPRWGADLGGHPSENARLMPGCPVQKRTPPLRVADALVVRRRPGRRYRERSGRTWADLAQPTVRSERAASDHG